MTFIDDNYLDGIITRMTKEHKENIMRTARRLNLPDDDVLFLYIGAVEYTVQLCEDVLGGISTERQSIEQSSQLIQHHHQKLSQNLSDSLIRAGRDIVSDIQSSGSAATSAIASANSEVLSQSRATVTEATELLDQLMAFRATVETDRETNENVLKALLRKIGEITNKLETTQKEINDSRTALALLQQNTKWIKLAEWFSPLAALGLAAIAGAAVWGWGLHMYWGEAEKYLTIVRKNQAAFNRCFTPDGYMKPGIICTVGTEKKK